jgi:hypothetical protein
MERAADDGVSVLVLEVCWAKILKHDPILEQVIDGEQQGMRNCDCRSLLAPPPGQTTVASGEEGRSS